MDQRTIEPMIHDARAQIRAGRLESAARMLQQVVAQQPDHADANANLGLIALMAGQFGPAEAHLRTALKADPSHLPAASNLAILFRRTNRARLSLDLQRQIISLEPNNADNHYNLANTLLDLGDFDSAISLYQSTLSLQPAHAQAMTNLARAYDSTFQKDLWLETIREAVAISRDPLPLSNYIFCSMFSSTASASDVASLAESWEVRFGNSSRPAVGFANTRDANRVLRIGYVSPNLRGHSSGWLTEPILANHDRPRFTIHCYSDVPRPDEVTQRISRSVDLFRESAQLTDDQLAQQIRVDQIDILIDLNAHMASSRLGVFARRAAPIQIGYLAYPFTCGLRAMDYRFTDEILDPPDAPRHGPERLIRLNHSFWLYRPDPATAEPAPAPPAQQRGFITFGDLNNVRKLSEPLLTAWAQIMQSVDGSRLVQFTNDPSSQGPRLLTMFAKAGIARERIELVGFESHHAHLNRYRDIDLCLDPFPYGGHTTTLDATWMGVPTVTLAGNAPYMRGAASILPRVGLDTLVTRSTDDYVRTAIELARDPARLVSLRTDLQKRMRSSDLCDEVGFVAEFERGLRMTWNRYCADLPPIDLDPAR